MKNTILFAILISLLAFSVTAATCGTPEDITKADLTGGAQLVPDGKINFGDNWYILFQKLKWGCATNYADIPECRKADINKDTILDNKDWNVVQSQTGCTQQGNTCYDQDGNNSLIATITYGLASNQGYDTRDTCIDNRYLKEYICSGGTSTPTTFDCQNLGPTYTCKTGRCQPGPAPICTDTDGGIIPTIQGKIFLGSIYKAVDSCTGTNNMSVNEYYCVGPSNYTSTIMDCSEGCYNGACRALTNISCVDSDGNDKFLKGNVTVTTSAGTSIVEHDQCAGSNVKEWLCGVNNSATYTIQPCASGCFDGACSNPVTNISCVDSDGGIEVFVGGNVSVTQSDGSVLVEHDVCSSGNNLREWFCSFNNTMSYQVQQCPTGNSCLPQDNKCTPTPINTTCTDTDGGIIVGQQGKVFLGDLYKATDSCGGTENNSVNEFYCNSPSNYTSELILCGSGCFDGACHSNQTNITG